MEDRVLDWAVYEKTAREMVAEGLVLLKNDNKALPLKQGETVSVFGRMQNHYYKSGTGSGGMVNVAKVVGILDALNECKDVNVNQKLAETYAAWDKEHPVELGLGWGQEPWSQAEMPVTEELVQEAAGESDSAIVIIARTAGEDKDNTLEKGAFMLTDIETDMLRLVRENFQKMVVLLNVGGLIDMSFLDTISPDACMYVWQGGMVGGYGVVDVLVGDVSPSGKLTDTIAYDIKDYPAYDNFGGEERNFYAEDIYVGYRYFETFAKDKVRYPFGYGLSYTDFKIGVKHASLDFEKGVANICVKVTNTGKRLGKEVVQVYGEMPQGRLGKPSRVLIDFAKTKELVPGLSDELKFEIPLERMASFDDSGATGHRNCYVLEAGDYTIHVGNSIRNTTECLFFELAETVELKKLQEALAPYEKFDRMKPFCDENGRMLIEYEETPLVTVDMYDRREQELPEEIPVTGDKGITLLDVKEGRASMDEFIAQFDDEDLACFVRGEGMGSSLVTAGTASAFAGVSPNLIAHKIPSVCCDDGPSGMRLDSGMKAFSLPNGTLCGCSFNRELNTRLYALLGLEMTANKVEVLLGPGMNIHRHPLNGRNFEYFSEDPYLTGSIATAQLEGLKSSGVSGTIKHFCGNNQEYHRHTMDSVISQRALREIYLKGFEIAVKSGYADSVMTTYGLVNGLYTAGSYDLNTTILRNEWGFTGVVMTDWWASINRRGMEPDANDFATMIQAQNDMYMCCLDGSKNMGGDNVLEALQDGRILRAELQRIAKNVCSFAMDTNAFKRLVGEPVEIEIINRPKQADDFSIDDVEYINVDRDILIDLTEKASTADTNYVIALDVEHPGEYEVSLRGSSTLEKLAQLPCTLFFNGFPVSNFTFNGTDGKDVVIRKEVKFYGRFNVLRLYVKSNGLDLKDIKFSFEKEF
ncbi:beta-glucosidase [Coprococcus eutactus]|uniref:glycoside hydrolase family 3 protein n=1 Tax=Coprococcus eutactus TaxID=33043 RepID=UPI001C01A7D0|nr:glycoside hydrolase family 3 protein [Coprococcus eutactus]MBT9730904.1 beta-glucosidase [Coprococcus eutactus]